MEALIYATIDFCSHHYGEKNRRRVQINDFELATTYYGCLVWPVFVEIRDHFSHGCLEQNSPASHAIWLSRLSFWLQVIKLELKLAVAWF